MVEIIWTDESQRRLWEIYDYIATDNPQAALRTVQAIHRKVDMLRTLPEIGQRYLRIEGRHVRTLVSGNYRIVYLIRSDGRIDILGVYHGRMDLDRRLQEDHHDLF